MTTLTGGCATPTPTPDPIAIALDQANRLVAQGAYTAAEAVYQSALDDHQDADLALALVDLYATWGRPEQGLQALELARAAGVTETTLAEHRLTLETMAADWPRVIETAESRLLAVPDDTTALEALLQATLQQGACDQAEDAARALAAAGGATETLHLLEGDFVALEATAPLLMAGLEGCGDGCDLQMGLRLVRAQRWSEAVCLLERALDTTTGTGNPAAGSPAVVGEAYAWLGEAESRTGHPLAAEQHLRTAVDLAPTSPLTWLLLGKQRLDRGDLDTARIALLNAQRLDPANPAPCLAIAELKAQTGAYDEVDRWIDAALERALQDAEVWKAAARFYLARDLASQRNPTGIADTAVDLAPDDGEAHLLRGWSALVNGSPGTALTALDRALELDPLLAEGHHLRGLALEAEGRSAEAREAFIRAADLGWRTGSGWALPKP